MSLFLKLESEDSVLLEDGSGTILRDTIYTNSVSAVELFGGTYTRETNGVVGSWGFSHSYQNAADARKDSMQSLTNAGYSV